MHCGLILAGGDSTRMGLEKHSLKISQSKMVEMVVEALQASGCQTLIIATRDGQTWPGWDVRRKVRFVADEDDWVGPQAGLAAGLNEAVSLGCEWVQLAPCDVPLLDPDLLLMLQSEASPEFAAVVPEGPNGLEPLLALVQPGMMLAALYRVRESQKRSIFAVLESMAVKKISRANIKGLEIADSCFLNVNLPEDLDLARELSKR